MRTIALFDAPHDRTRLRIESVLRAHGYVWLFPNARWCARSGNHARAIRAVRARLTGHSYRLAFIVVGGRTKPDIRWLTGTVEEAR